MIGSTARWATPHAARYLQQLCKHFAHKVEARWDDAAGRVELATGPAELRAEGGALVVRVTAPDLRTLIAARYAIDSHLVTFAHREGFAGLAWTLDPAEAA